MTLKHWACHGVWPQKVLLEITFSSDTLELWRAETGIDTENVSTKLLCVA